VLADQIVNGLVLGAVYSLAAVSFALVMGVLGVLNVASAALFLLGGYIGVDMISGGSSIWGALLVVIAATGIGGIVVERVGYRPFRDSPVVIPLLSTLGLTIVVQGVVINAWGSDPIQLGGAPLRGRVELAGIALTATELLIMGAAIVILAGVGAMMRWTWMGRSIRAVAEDRHTASLLGVPAVKVTVATFALSGLLAGTAGLLIGVNYGVLSPTSGLELGLKGIAVMVVGGVRNIWGGLLAGPLLGIAEVLAIAYGDSAWRDMVVWGFLILVLLVRPEGLFSRGEPSPHRA
jgi:branched-chain amino acid transport system permease protein